MLKKSQGERITAQDALNHAWFDSIREQKDIKLGKMVFNRDMVSHIKKY